MRGNPYRATSPGAELPRDNKQFLKFQCVVMEAGIETVRSAKKLGSLASDHGSARAVAGHTVKVFGSKLTRYTDQLQIPGRISAFLQGYAGGISTAGLDQNLCKLFKHNTRFCSQEFGQVFPCTQLLTGIGSTGRAPVQLRRDYDVVRASRLVRKQWLRGYDSRDRFVGSALGKSCCSLRILNVHDYLAHYLLFATSSVSLIIDKRNPANGPLWRTTQTQSVLSLTPKRSCTNLQVASSRKPATCMARCAALIPEILQGRWGAPSGRQTFESHEDVSVSATTLFVMWTSLQVALVGEMMRTGSNMQNQPYRNTVLQHLDSSIVERLHLRAVDLPLGYNLQNPGQAIDHIYFIEAGVGSFTALFENGAQVEIAMLGYESVVGVSALMGARKSLNHVSMQLAGHGFASPLATVKEEFKRNETFHDLALRYVQAQLTQVAQSAACNATHNHAQRLARWLLICCDRGKSETLAISQEFIAMMLGSRRTTVTLAAGLLKEKGIIEYRRGCIHILDREALEIESCECYLTVKAHLSNLTEFDTGFTI